VAYETAGKDLLTKGNIGSLPEWVMDDAHRSAIQFGQVISIRQV
jgi:hypothetical protein